MQRCCVLLATLLVLSYAPISHATEGGGGAYPNGAEGHMAGAIPPPGHYIIDYGLYYSADDFMGDDGRAAVPGFDLEVMGDVLRYIHVSKTQILGGFWAQHIFVPILDMDVTVPRVDENGQIVGTVSDDDMGLGDIIVDPFILGWHSGPWHTAAGVDVYVPVGHYDEDNLANIGRGYWTFEPVFACTYLTRNGYEASAKFMYDINTENTDTDYQSGQEFHFDYALTKQIKNWNVGLGGYYYEQITDDEIDGVEVDELPEPNPQAQQKGKTIAWGPQLSYQHGPLCLTLKYQTETETENRPEGDKVWLKIIWPL